LVTAFGACVVAGARKFFGNTLHRFRVIYSSNVGLVLDVNLVQHYILLAVLLAFLAGAINTNIPVHAVARLKVINLLAQTILLLHHVILLIRCSSHIVANQVATVVNQLLLSLLLSAVNTGPLAHILSLRILNVSFVRLV
jgi:hypothetical protein